MGEEKFWPELKTIIREAMWGPINNIERIKADIEKVNEDIARDSDITRNYNKIIHESGKVVESVDMIFRVRMLGDVVRSELGEIRSSFVERRERAVLEKEDHVERGNEIYERQKSLILELALEEDLLDHYKSILSDLNWHIRSVFKTHSIKKVKKIRRREALVTGSNIHGIVELWKEFIGYGQYKHFIGEEVLYIAHHDVICRLIGRNFITKALVVERLKNLDPEIREITKNLLRDNYGIEEEEGVSE